MEVQIFGDGAGGCVALGERECSIQVGGGGGVRPFFSGGVLV